MSQRYYYPPQGDDVEVFCGWENAWGQDLGYFFLVISRNSGPEKGFNDVIWSNRKDHEGPAMTLADVRKVLEQHGISAPAELFAQLEADKENNSNETSHINEWRHS